MVQYKLKQRGFYYFNSTPALAFLCECVCVSSVPGVKVCNCTVRGYIDEKGRGGKITLRGGLACK